MTALDDADRSALARHLAALRRHGASLGGALTLLHEKLPDGPARALVREVQDSLARGEAPAASGDPLLALLARGDAASPEVLDEAVRAFELSLEARHARRAGSTSVLIIAGALGLGLAAAGFVVEPAFDGLYRHLSGSMPPVTRLSLGLLWLARPLAILGLAAAVGALVLRARIGRVFPGAQALERAAGLQLHAAGLAAGSIDATTLQIVDLTPDPHERALGARLLHAHPPATALRILSSEVASEAASLHRRALQLVSPVALVLVGAVVGGILVGLYLPIFSIAGSIQ